MPVHIGFNGVSRALSDLISIVVNAAHPGLGSEGHEGGLKLLHIPCADSEALLCQNHNAASLRSFVCQG